MRLPPLTAAFFLGRLVSYSLYMAGASVLKDTDVGGLIRTSFTSRCLVESGRRVEPDRVERCRTGVQRRLLGLVGLLFLSVLVAFGVPAGPASAGGWAVTTLDAVPAVRVGDLVPVGFVIRQHGVRPVQLDVDVGIEVRAASGRVELFAASPRGPLGHYVADVVFREAGDATWSVHQGWFGPQDLGVIVVASRAGVVSVSRHDWPAPVRVGLPVLALGAAAFAVGDVVRCRRRVAS